MLLGNDAFEGQSAGQMAEADRVFLLLKGHMRRMREQLGVSIDQQPTVERLAVSPQFQAELSTVWQWYLAVQQELAADELRKADQAISNLNSAVNRVTAADLSGRAGNVWKREKASLIKLIANLDEASDIQAMRTAFKPLSEQIGVLARSFGFGEANPVYELHCPMAFGGQGAVWYQRDDQVRNPYYGASMLKCADRVERLVHEKPAKPLTPDSHQDHSQH